MAEPAAALDSELDPPDARACRDRMVEVQLAGRGIRDAHVLAAFRRVPRHLFCPPGTPLSSAYGDHPLPIGLGQTISQPLMVAEMTAALGLAGGERVLEIGTGSGYQAAILACLACEVHTVERLSALAGRARVALARAGFATVRVYEGDGTLGLPGAAPFDAIVVTAAAPEVPEPLRWQLVEGGRLAVPVGPRDIQELIVCTRRGDRLARREAGGCRFVPLIGRHGWPEAGHS